MSLYRRTSASARVRGWEGGEIDLSEEFYLKRIYRRGALFPQIIYLFYRDADIGRSTGEKSTVLN